MKLKFSPFLKCFFSPSLQSLNYDEIIKIMYKYWCARKSKTWYASFVFVYLLNGAFPFHVMGDQQESHN